MTNSSPAGHDARGAVEETTRLALHPSGDGAGGFVVRDVELAKRVCIAGCGGLQQIIVAAHLPGLCARPSGCDNDGHLIMRCGRKALYPRGRQQRLRPSRAGQVEERQDRLVEIRRSAGCFVHAVVDAPVDHNRLSSSCPLSREGSSAWPHWS
jgi:hypothetical protein